MVYSQLFSIVIKQFTYCVKVLITRNLWLTVITNMKKFIAGTPYRYTNYQGANENKN
jgi:hypothetical protein